MVKQERLHPLCGLCLKPFMSNLDACLCDACVNEAYRHKPELYVRISLADGSSFVVPQSEVGHALLNEFDADAQAGWSWTITLVEMSKAEYEALPEFAGH